MAPGFKQVAQGPGLQVSFTGQWEEKQGWPTQGRDQKVSSIAHFESNFLVGVFYKRIVADMNLTRDSSSAWT